MPSGPIGICRRVVVVFLGAASVFHRDAQVTSAAVGSGLRIPTVTTLSQAAIDAAMSKHARAQEIDDPEHSERRVSTDGLFAIFTCMEGQSFSIVSSRCPYFDGYYTESGLGRIPRSTGEYTYALSEGGTNDTNTNITTAVVAVTLHGLQFAHWLLGSTLANDSTTCVSLLPADHSHHPADSPWMCDFSGNGTGLVTPNATELSVSCGCSGSRTTFDRQAALLKEKRRMEPFMSARTQYHPRDNSSHYVGVRLIWAFLASYIAFIARMHNARRISRSRRIQETLRARDAEAGVELPERTAETLPLHSGELQAVETEQ